MKRPLLNAILEGTLEGTPTSGTLDLSNLTLTLPASLTSTFFDFKGNFSASGNPNYPVGVKGDVYYISVAGKVGGGSGKTVTVGDMLICSVDNAGGTEASVGTSWFVTESNLDMTNVAITGGTITGTTVSGVTFSGSGSLANSGTSSLTGFTGSGTSSGTNTGDQTSVTGNAGTATALATPRNIFNISFNGTSNVAGDATNTGHFASIPGTGAAGHFVTENGTVPTLIAGRSAWYSNGSGVPSFKNGTGTAVTLVSSSDLGTGVATFLATPSSANLAAAVTDETGSGALVFGTSPTFTTSIIAGSSTMALLNATATTINFGGAASAAINIGNSAGDLIVAAGELLPAANDGTTLGKSTFGFSDLFLASGAVINFSNGDVLITHSTDTLTVTGSTNLTLTSGVTTGSGLAVTSSTLSSGKLVSLASTSTASGTQYGLDISLTNSYSSSAFTSYGVNVVNSRYGNLGSCTTYGALFTVSTPGGYGNTHYGVSSVVSNYSYGSGTNYGFHTALSSCGSTSTNYGVYSSVNTSGVNNYAGWFSALNGTTNYAIYVSSGNSYFQTITNGTWNGTAIGVAYGGTGVSTSGTTSQIAVGGGTGSPIVWTTATGTGAPVRADSPTFTTATLFPDGAAATPALRFAADTDCGIYRIGTNNFGFATNGVLRWHISSGGSLFSGSGNYDYTIGASLFLGSSGSASAPTFSFGSSTDTNTGMYRVGEDQLGFTAGGTLQFTVNTTGITIGGTTAAVTTATRLTKLTSSIADNTATAVLTVTIPNAAHAASLRVRLLGRLGAGGAIGADEASGTVTYDFAIARTAGVNAVVTASTAFGSAMTAVAGAATVTVTAAPSAISGAVGASNSFTVDVTIAKSGGASANHTCTIVAEVLNANATGITIA